MIKSHYNRILTATFMLIFFVTVNIFASNYDVNDYSMTIKDVENFDEVNDIISSTKNITLISTYEYENSLTYQLLIPIDEFDTFINKINDSGKVTYKSSTQNNIINDIIQLETKIKNENEHKTVIMEMIRQADELNTILQLEQHLIDVEVSQTTNQNSLNSLKSKVENVHINLEIYKKLEQQPTKTTITFSQKLKSNFVNSYNGTLLFIQNVIVIFSYIFIPICLLSIIVIIVFKIKKGGKKK